MKNIKPPTSQEGVHNFIGLVRYHCDMWKIISHTLYLLTELTGDKVKFKWTDIKQKAV